MLRWVVLSIAVLAMGSVSLAQSSSGSEIRLLGEPRTTIDNRVNVRVQVWSNGQPVGDLNSASFSVSEQATPLTVQAVPDQEAIFVVVVNRFRMTGDAVSQARLFLQTYANDYAREGDRFILSTGSEGVLVSDNAADLRTMLDGIVAISDTDSTTEANITDVLAQVRAARSDKPNAIVRVVYIANDLYAPTFVPNWVGRIGTEGYRMHVLHVAGQSSNALQSIQARGGTYAQMNGGVLNVNGETVGVAQHPLFADVTLSRNSYNIEYQSLVTSTGQRNVVLRARLSDVSNVETEFSYNPTFSPPTIAIVDGAFNLTRDFVEAGSSELTTPTSQVRVRVSFNDGDIQRRLESLTLRVYPPGGGTPTAISAESLQSSDDVYSFVWPLDNYSAPETTYNLSLDVIVRDEVGLEAVTDPIPATVIVGAFIEELEPEILFTQPTDFVPERAFSEDGTLSNPMQTLYFEVRLPESFAGSPGNMSLFMVGTGADGQPEEQTLILQPFSLDEQGRFNVDWDISSYEEAAQEYPVKLRVEASFDDGTVLSDEADFRIVVGETIPIPQWVVCRFIVPAITPECPFTSDADVPTYGAFYGGTLVLFIVYLRFTNSGRQIVTAATQRVGGAVKAVTQRLQSSRSGDVFADIEWEDRTTGNSGKLVMNREWFNIGRDDDSHGVITSPSVSRKHAQIRVKNGTFEVKDVGSSLGTSIDGDTIPPDRWVELDSANDFYFGDVRLRLTPRDGASAGASRIAPTSRQPTGRAERPRSDDPQDAPPPKRNIQTDRVRRASDVEPEPEPEEDYDDIAPENVPTPSPNQPAKNDRGSGRSNNRYASRGGRNSTNSSDLMSG
jgi:hypothetical protein